MWESQGRGRSGMVHMPVNPATWEMEIGTMVIEDQRGQEVSETPP
jgi:hypothetical protein